jgi:crossover junction endodeoxyribonuclease RuvC
MPLQHDGQLDAPALADLMSGAILRANIRGVVERVSSLPRQAGAFNFGLSTGIVRGILAANRIPFELVHPSVWKRAMGLTRFGCETQPENKTRARALASQLFPTLADQFKRVRDDGRAEALLLAVYYHNRGEK